MYSLFINSCSTHNIIFPCIYLSLAPQGGHFYRVDNLENSLLSVNPVYVVTIVLRLEQQLLDKLPEVDVVTSSGGGRLHLNLLFLLI